MSRQCCMKVFNTKTSKWRPCRGHGCPNGFCHAHQKHFFAETIQKHWRSYRVRTKIVIYKHLPTDLWRKVREHMQPEYSKKFLEATLRLYETHQWRWKRIAMFGIGITPEQRSICYKLYYNSLEKHSKVKNYTEYHY